MMVFTPIEQVMKWPPARAVVMWGIPQSIMLKIDDVDRQVMRMDCEWASKLLCFLPEEDRPTFLKRLEVVYEAIAQAVPPDRIRPFVREPATQRTLSRANEQLHIIDLERERAGLPTFVQLIKHHLGIEAAPGTVAVTMKLTFGNDPYEQKQLESCQQDCQSLTAAHHNQQGIDP